MRKGLSVKDLAERIGAADPAVDRARLVEQLRYWTRLDLLRPSGPKHGGSGRWRTYPGSTVFIAAVLCELSRYRVAVPVMAAVATTLRMGLEGAPDAGTPAVESEIGDLAMTDAGAATETAAGSGAGPDSSQDPDISQDTDQDISRNIDQGSRHGDEAGGGRTVAYYAARLLEALEGRRDIFLTVHAEAGNKAARVDLAYAPLDPEGPAAGARSAILLNLTSVFGGLR